MFRVKICGIKTVEDGLAVAGAGADAVGLNFYPKSPRFVDPQGAARIVDALPDGVVKVGLFVNSPAGEICTTFDRLGLDLIQLHGDEPPDLLAELGERPVMRAFRPGSDGWESIRSYVDACRRLNCNLRLLLIDACVKGTYGGTGQLADWQALEDHAPGVSTPPLVLAGGLTPQNVAEAIRRVRPSAVDTASGVESAPGVKDHLLVEQFVTAAREAFDLGK